MASGRRLLAVLALSLLFVFVQVRPSLPIPMLEDDYLTNRPWSAAQVATA